MTYNYPIKIRFYLTSSGRCPVEAFLQKCSRRIKEDFFDAISLLADGHILKMPLSRSLSGIYRGLHELRFKDKDGQVRFFYIIRKKDGIYLIHALRKKSQKLPHEEIALMLNRIKELI